MAIEVVTPTSADQEKMPKEVEGGEVMEVTEVVESQDIMECGEGFMFSFEVPEVRRDTVMRVNAPDGIAIELKRCKKMWAGDKVVLIKLADGRWDVKHIIRTEPVASLDWSGKVIQRTDAELDADLNGVATTKVTLHTTKGPIKVRICATWAPLGAQRFMQLVADGFFTDVCFYRVVPDFLVQYGIVKDSEDSKAYAAINDDPLCGVPVQEGTICFSAAGPNTRKNAICIFLTDFPDLGKNSWETPIGRVDAESMETLRNIYSGYGDMPQAGGSGPDPVELEEKGNEYIRENFPECDFVEKAIWEE